MLALRHLFLASTLLACTDEPEGPSASDSEAREQPDSAADTAPAPPSAIPVGAAYADAEVLLMQLDADGVVTVEGRTEGEAWVDLDPSAEREEAFRVRALVEGEVVWEASWPGPVLVREFLEVYGVDYELDLLAWFPQLGRFPLHVPRLGDELVFELRGDDGVYTEAGRTSWEAVEALEPEPVLDEVVGWETLYGDGEAARRLDLVLLGDGYTDDELDTWRSDAAELAEALVQTAPFSSWSAALRIHRVDVASAESGASFDCEGCTWRDTALGSIYPLELVNQLTGADYRRTSLFQEDQFAIARAASVVPWDLAFVLVNSANGGGMAIHVATAGRDDNWIDTSLHELGHLVGRVGDEYVKDACIRSAALGLPVNVAESAEGAWDHWLDEEGVGAWEGAYNCEDLYRPVDSCKMRSSSQAFCPICTEAIVRRLFAYVDPLDDAELVDGELVTSGPFEPSLELTEDEAGVQLRATLSTDEVREGTLEELWTWAYE